MKEKISKLVTELKKNGVLSLFLDDGFCEENVITLSQEKMVQLGYEEIHVSVSKGYHNSFHVTQKIEQLRVQAPMDQKNLNILLQKNGINKEQLENLKQLVKEVQELNVGIEDIKLAGSKDEVYISYERLKDMDGHKKVRNVEDSCIIIKSTFDNIVFKSIVNKEEFKEHFPELVRQIEKQKKKCIQEMER